MSGQQKKNPPTPTPPQWVSPEQAFNTMDAPEYVPLCVEVDLVTPVLAYESAISLDGLLAYGAYCEWLLCDESKVFELPLLDHTSNPVDFALPLAKWTEAPVERMPCARELLNAAGQIWGWCASHSMQDWLFLERGEVRGRSPFNELLKYGTAGRVNGASGTYKGINLAYEGRYAPTLRWYARGIREDVERLLSHVTHIGKRHNTGHGKVALREDGKPSWRVTEVEHDYSIEKDGVLTRPMPWRGEGPGRLLKLRAPYHHQSRQAFCAVPGS